MRLEGVDGELRLPLSCKIGDWTHSENFESGKCNEQPFVKVLPKPPPPDLSKINEPNSTVEVWTFERFWYYQNGVRLAAFRRIQ